MKNSQKDHPGYSTSKEKNTKPIKGIRFINLFVKAQKQLNQLKDQRRTQYKQAATGLFSDMVKLIDVKFSELDRR
ncbi:unnamed protein product [Parnassius apollo]|uniref:(apollo) hypothetical protein n=1 Tax=Parnassius apollo TaxID=110799 RepID=A0A8S3Y6W0_PARAO|nr:unnamed protein product [Parnassius apollo]